jgi:lipoprotein-anchoring transpeptidase ErfK/SrfK
LIGLSRTTRHTRRRAQRAAVLLPVLLVPVVAACTAAPSTSGPAVAAASETQTPSPGPEPVALETNVADGATVPVDTRVEVTASGGSVTQVALTYKDPKAGPVTVEGALAPDGSSWTAQSLLEPGRAYTLSMTGTNADGAPTTVQRTFTSDALSRKQEIYPTLAASGSTVGVAMPVVVTFDVPVQDKAGFQKKMTVTSAPAQPGSWSWISNTEAHWRPQEYWHPGTKVSVNLDLNSVPGGNGTFGQLSLSGGFTVGNSVVMNSDLASHQMTVLVDGNVARTIPITGGKKGWETRSGTKVVMQKHSTVKMDAGTLGLEPGDANYYSIPNVRYAMRETWSGEFVHAAPWSVGSQGRANVSHGCIGMSTANAAWLFGQAKVGDPIVVTGTGRGLEKGNGWTDWNVSYEEFKKSSALPG